MSKSIARTLFCACLLFNGSASAFDLNGAWTQDERNCDKVFIKKNNKILMTRNSDRFGGGFIAEGNQIRGLGKTCKIINRKEEGGVLNLLASCTTDIALLDAEQITARIVSDDLLTRIYPSFPEAGTSYYRCKF
jgi:hypothetical protein